MIGYRDETNGLDTEVDFVPYILINGNHIDHFDFEKSLICSKYCGVTPKICLEYDSDEINFNSHEKFSPPSLKILTAISVLRFIHL